MTLAHAIANAIPRLAAVSDSPRQDAERLLAELLGLSRAQLFSRLEAALSPPVQTRFEQWLERRARGEPVAYILGERGFWTLNLTVSPAVLVPRPETEGLVEWALAVLAGQHAPRVADLGTGSGAIALALASERPDADVTGIDLSAAALAVPILSLWMDPLMAAGVLLPIFLVSDVVGVWLYRREFSARNVALLIPCRRHTSAVFSPASCSRRIAMTCSSLNFDRFIVRSSRSAGL